MSSRSGVNVSILPNYQTYVNKLEPPEAIIQQLNGSLRQRVRCTINHTVKFQAGLVAPRNNEVYISVNAKRLKELQCKEGDLVTVALEKDAS